MRPDDTLSKLVNQSGFPLQLAVQHLVESHQHGDGWRVLYREHGWSSPDGQSGFADLVLEDTYHTSVLVLECKRVLDCDWIFPIDRREFKKTQNTRAWVTNTEGHGKFHFGHFDARTKPESVESMFCIVAGQDAKSRPMLERVAAETIAATEAIALEEQETLFARKNGFRMYASVIVTTSRLVLTYLDISQIDLSNGEAKQQHHEVLPWIRFRKQFSSSYAIEPDHGDWDLKNLAKAKEKTVFVVNAEHLAEFLSQWDIDNKSLRPLMS